MEIKILGAAKEVTGSCYSLATKDEQILIDCGMFQGSKDNEKLNHEEFNFNPKEYDALILTHAHLDHCGRIPKLVRYGFKGKIFATDATKELASIVMMDAAKIAAEDTEHENQRRAEQGLPARKPIYNDVDVKNTIKLFVSAPYDEDIKISKNILARFYDAGHILGSASVQLKVKEKKKSSLVVFSGDLGQANSILVKDTEPIKKADYIFIESTYGDRLHPPIEERKKELLRILNDTYKRGGKLLVPSFAVERAQEIIYYVGEFMQDSSVPNMKVYLDSPMALKATDVFEKFPNYYNDEVRKEFKKRGDPFNFPGLIRTATTEQSKSINYVKEPCVIIAGNGMCTAGRIKQHIRINITNQKNTLLFIGYQAYGTLGYWLKNGEKKVRLLGEELKVNSKIEAIDGFSSHADYIGLINWLKNFSSKPKKVFITHGDLEQSSAFSRRLESIGYTTYLPSLNEKLEI